MDVGYARVSTDHQIAKAQLDALKAAGCKHLFEEHASGGRWGQPGLYRMLDQLLEGDVAIVWKLDRSRVRSKTFLRSWRRSMLQVLGFAP